MPPTSFTDSEEDGSPALPKHMPTEPFDPYAKKNIRASIGQALLTSPVRSMEDPLAKFDGAGIYALYYTGTLPLYQKLTEANRDGRFGWPIYVGRVYPPGARKGAIDIDDDHGPCMWRRLKDHRNSIAAVDNLSVEDFSCRYLVLDDLHIRQGEAFMISKFQPVWNAVLEGFGNHAPGAGRGTGQRPKWDMVHPGRAWADNLPENDEPDDRLLWSAMVHLSATRPMEQKTVVLPA